MIKQNNGVVNFDNAATSYPKPAEVKKAALYAMERCGGNAGRGGHALSMLTSSEVFSARQAIADFFYAEPDNVVFTLNCTHALNLAIKGIMEGGGHIITSALEHNSVSRPIISMNRKGRISYSIAPVYSDNQKTVQAFRELITPKTKAIACTIASNVTGQLLPYKEIGKLCREKNICFIADGAQACGIIPVTLDDGINILCTSGHKGLYGLTGTGLLVSDGRYALPPLMEGGTGSGSQSLSQPDFLPDSLESGTLNTVGILSLKAGIDFLKKKGIERINAYEAMLIQRLINGLQSIEGCTVYRSREADYVPIVSFNLKDTAPEKLAEYLNDEGFCLRAGYHCAALAHKYLGTDGTVRFAPSAFNSETEVQRLIAAINSFNNGNYVS